MPDHDVKHVPPEGMIVGTIQRLLDGEDPTDKERYEQQQTSNILSDAELLWYDVLEFAVDDYKQNLLAVHTPQMNIFSDVFDWFFNEHLNLVHLGSFESICLILEINPSVIRKKLIVWTQEMYKKKDADPSLQEEKKTKQTAVFYVNKNDII